MMKFAMKSASWKQPQIAWIVVFLVAVFVMDNLSGFEVATEGFGGNDAMSTDVFSVDAQFDVTIERSSPTFPGRMICFSANMRFADARKLILWDIGLLNHGLDHPFGAIVFLGQSRKRQAFVPVAVHDIVTGCVESARTWVFNSNLQVLSRLPFIASHPFAKAVADCANRHSVSFCQALIGLLACCIQRNNFVSLCKQNSRWAFASRRWLIVFRKMAAFVGHGISHRWNSDFATQRSV